MTNDNSPYYRRVLSGGLDADESAAIDEVSDIVSNDLLYMYLGSTTQTSTILNRGVAPLAVLMMGVTQRGEKFPCIHPKRVGFAVKLPTASRRPQSTSTPRRLVQA